MHACYENIFTIQIKYIATHYITECIVILCMRRSHRKRMFRIQHPSVSTKITLM